MVLTLAASSSLRQRKYTESRFVVSSETCSRLCFDFGCRGKALFQRFTSRVDCNKTDALRIFEAPDAPRVPFLAFQARNQTVSQAPRTNTAAGGRPGRAPRTA